MITTLQRCVRTLHRPVTQGARFGPRRGRMIAHLHGRCTVRSWAMMAEGKVCRSLRSVVGASAITLDSRARRSVPTGMASDVFADGAPPEFRLGDDPEQVNGSIAPSLSRGKEARLCSAPTSETGNGNGNVRSGRGAETALDPVERINLPFWSDLHASPDTIDVQPPPRIPSAENKFGCSVASRRQRHARYSVCGLDTVESVTCVSGSWSAGNESRDQCRQAHGAESRVLARGAKARCVDGRPIQHLRLNRWPSLGRSRPARNGELMVPCRSSCVRNRDSCRHRDRSDACGQTRSSSYALLGSPQLERGTRHRAVSPRDCRFGWGW